MAAYRFTNVYRASDRVSQYLITRVLYDSDRSWTDTFVRVLIFKIFNRIDTWEYLQAAIGEISVTTLRGGGIEEAIAARASQHPVYSAAYIMPPPRKRLGPKSQRHIALVREMVSQGAHERIAEATTMSSAFNVLVSYDSIGPFLAYQFLVDLNYSRHLVFSEDEFVVAGPGARRGLRKCFADPGDYGVSDMLRWTMDAQETAFNDRGLAWTDLWGRALQLIDIQNLFCEVDKYSRVACPELSEFAPGQRIKQRYRPNPEPLTAWFPPKWGLNERIASPQWNLANQQNAHPLNNSEDVEFRHLRRFPGDVLDTSERQLERSPDDDNRDDGSTGRHPMADPLM